ncbi:hypothetical protein C8J56DRAFT_1058437 [Mycena floridula]|nr:hypothetical protein C8J56DRAFT_1058437 [Mycena floridula]
MTTGKPYSPLSEPPLFRRGPCIKVERLFDHCYPIISNDSRAEPVSLQPLLPRLWLTIPQSFGDLSPGPDAITFWVNSVSAIHSVFGCSALSPFPAGEFVRNEEITAILQAWHRSSSAKSLKDSSLCSILQRPLCRAERCSVCLQREDAPPGRFILLIRSVSSQLEADTVRSHPRPLSMIMSDIVLSLIDETFILWIVDTEDICEGGAEAELVTETLIDVGAILMSVRRCPSGSRSTFIENLRFPKPDPSSGPNFNMLDAFEPLRMSDSPNLALLQPVSPLSPKSSAAAAAGRKFFVRADPLADGCAIVVYP